MYASSFVCRTTGSAKRREGMTISLKQVDKVEILTLQDNYVDLVSRDDTEMVVRAKPLKGLEVKNSILAEHGFSAVVTVTTGTASRSLLFDFGFSENGAALNADALSASLSEVDVLVLSHGHMDHFGGLEALRQRLGKEHIDLVLHPAAFKSPRYMKITEALKIGFPSLSRENAEAMGIRMRETRDPLSLLDGQALFLGEIPRRTDFEKGVPYLFCQQDGKEMQDPLEDDTGIAVHLRGKGLVILSGCAHAGIVNTVKYAREATGIEDVHVIMGGFHLTGPDFVPSIGPTTEALKAFDPRYVVPTHCTGRRAIQHMESEMPDRFILNMSGTKLVFAA
jgi:7,8-dihydropterin-6-yl-methyl-4-(beta-D-ribofuranosyl)aminobenzene 5'-phosphate synthase